MLVMIKTIRKKILFSIFVEYSSVCRNCPLMLLLKPSFYIFLFLCWFEIVNILSELNSLFS
jgi:hypothetical protein